MDNRTNKDGEVHFGAQIDPEDLLDSYVYDTFPTKKGTTITRKGIIRKFIDPDTYRVSFTGGKQRTYDYKQIIAMLNHDDEEGSDRWKYEEITNTGCARRSQVVFMPYIMGHYRNRNGHVVVILQESPPGDFNDGKRGHYELSRLP